MIRAGATGTSSLWVAGLPCEVAMPDVRLMLGDCLDRMAEIPDHSVDLILTDPPFGVTECRWDVVLDYRSLWEHYGRLIIRDGTIVMMASQPFTTDLICSNRKLFKYNLVWYKKQSGSFHLAKSSPLRVHEDVVVFGHGRGTYRPQMRTGRYRKRGGARRRNQAILGGLKDGFSNYSDQYYPTSIIEIPNERIGKLHPTQKPVALMEYLIRTYSDEGDTVLDPCMGSGTTGVACLNAGRRFVGIERDPTFFTVTERRIAEHRSKMQLFAAID